MKKLPVAILGTGNIGTDLLVKVLRSPVLECKLFSGRNLASPGMTKASLLNVPVSTKGLAGIMDGKGGIALVFDATNAADHVKHAPVFAEAGMLAVDLTPASVGRMCVPAVNLDACLGLPNVNMITCGGQASIPLAHAIARANPGVEYIEAVSSIASRSAGPATRINLDEYLLTTEHGLQTFAACDRTKAILNLNPAQPCVHMQTTGGDGGPDQTLRARLPAVDRAHHRERPIDHHGAGRRAGGLPAQVRGQSGYHQLRRHRVRRGRRPPRFAHPVNPMPASGPTITVCDATLRDGSHAYSHQINVGQIESYATAAEAAGFTFLEVGHGNGLGASSLQVGESLVPEGEMLRAAKKCLRNTKLSAHVMPGFATIKREIVNAMEAGVDLFRVGCHCTEADITQRHIGYVRSVGREAWGVLMMTHMASKEVLLEEAKKMQSYGAQGIMLMDSAGALFPADVTAKIGLLAGSLEVPVGFHAHHNLGLSIANSLAALEAGARIVDGTAKGFGAGAGNAPLELLAAVLKHQGYATSIDLYRALDAAELAARLFAGSLPNATGITVVSGLAGVFSGFAKPVQRAAEQLGVDPRDVFFELGRRKVVGGQEDLILEVATALARRLNPGARP